MSKRYRAAIHPDGTRSVRGTERERVYSWAVVRELPEGATYDRYNGYGYDAAPLQRYEVVSWRSDRESAQKYADKMPNQYLGNDAVYTVVPTEEVKA